MNKPAFDYEKAVRRGRQLSDKGEAAKAEAALMEAVEHYLAAGRQVPKSALRHVGEAYLGLGVAAREICRFGRVALFLENAFALGAGSDEHKLILAESLIPPGEPEKAEALCRAVLKKKPGSVAALRVLGFAQLWEKKFAEAETTLIEAVKADNKDVRVWTELGLAFEGQGKYGEAMAVFDQVKAAEPSLYEDYVDEAVIASTADQLGYARSQLVRAEKTAPRSAEAFFAIGYRYFVLGYKQDAQRAYLASLNVSQNSAALLELAKLYEKANDLERARTMALAARRLNPENPETGYVLGLCEMRRGNAKDALNFAREAAQAVPEVLARAEVHNTIGKLYDSLDKPDEALEAFQQCKDILKTSRRYRETNPGFPLRTLEAMNKLDLRKLPKPAFTRAPHEPEIHAFFVGFPRSGTTLLEKVLAAHPDITTIEEQPALATPLQVLRRFSNSYPAGLMTLTTEMGEELRKLYFLQARCYADTKSHKVLVDKLPLNLIHLPAILTLFPEAKVIVGLRHPLACSLSCLMQHFSLNNSMANLMSLDEITSFYAAVMGLWLKVREECEGDFHPVRYEDVVKDLEGEARKIARFLGVKWSEDMLKYAERAKEKGLINTPSYHQVVQPVYQDSLERWRAYEKFLAPYKKRLEPFCKAFGYSL